MTGPITSYRRGRSWRDALVPLEHIDVQMLGATRGRYVGVTADGQPRSDLMQHEDGKTYRVASTTPTTAYLNRALGSAFGSASVPGTQYVVLNMAAEKGKRFLVPYTVVVRVVGRAGHAAPT